jgi:HSP20 family protein
MFTLTPWKERENLAFPVPRFGNEFKTLYDRFFGGWPFPFEPVMGPERFWNLEVKDVEKEVFVRAEIPGFEATDLDIELKNNRLFIKAEKKHEKEMKEKGYEYAVRTYERIVELPAETDPAKVKATYRNGVLELHLPKTEVALGFHIPVK